MQLTEKQTKCLRIMLWELAFFEALSLFLILMLGGALWAAPLAPLWGIVAAAITFLAPGDSISQQIWPACAIIVACFLLIILALLGRINRWIGAIALFLYCLLSLVILIGLS